MGHMMRTGRGCSMCVEFAVGGGVSGGARSPGNQLPPPPPFRKAEMKNWSEAIKIHRSNKHFWLPRADSTVFTTCDSFAMLQKALVNWKRRAPLTNKVFLCSLVFLICLESFSGTNRYAASTFSCDTLHRRSWPFGSASSPLCLCPQLRLPLKSQLERLVFSPIPVKLPISHEHREITRGSLKWKWSLSHQGFSKASAGKSAFASVQRILFPRNQPPFPL